MDKKFLPIFLVLTLLVCLLSGCKEGWTEPEEDVGNGDITLSGSMYSGKAVVTVILHPDGTVDCDANGEKSDGTWETGSGDVAMVAHLTVKGETVDMDITDTGEGYSAEFPMVPGMILTGAKGAASAPKDITLSGSMYSGKAVCTVVLHPDGTLECDSNGEKSDGTWETGSGDVAMVAHFTVKGEQVDMDILETEGGYSAEHPMVPGMILTGAKTSSAAGTPEPPQQSDTPKQSDPPEQSDAPTCPENSLVLDFTADTSDQLQKTFYVESGTWGVAFGGQGDYTPTDSADELFAWNAGKVDSSFRLIFFADGTYKFEFTTMGVEETGTWTWADWELTVTSAGGNSFAASLNK